MPVLLLALLAGCSDGKDLSTAELERPANSPVVVHAVPVEVTYARGFSISSLPQASLVTVRGPVRSWSRGGEPEYREMRLVLAGDRFAEQLLPADWKDAVRVRVPVQRIVVNSQAEEAFISELGVKNRLVGIGGLKSWDEEIRARAESGELRQVGYSWHSPPNMDTVLALRPEVFIMRLADLDHAPSMERLLALGVPVVPYFIDAEDSYLGRAEWIRFFGLLTGRLEEADRIFAEIRQNSESIRERAAHLPKVPALWAYPTGRDRWFAMVRGVEAELLEHAGGENLLRRPDDPMQDSGVEIATEVLVEQGAPAEAWIIGDVHAAEIPEFSGLVRIRAFAGNRLFANDGRSLPAKDAYDLYERGFIRPDFLLRDLFAVLHEPAQLLPDAYFRRVPVPEAAP